MLPLLYIFLRTIFVYSLPTMIQGVFFLPNSYLSKAYILIGYNINKVSSSRTHHRGHHVVSFSKNDHHRIVMVYPLKTVKKFEK